MTVTVVAKFYQSAPSAPVQAISTNSFGTSADWSAETSDGFGVKATNAAPTNVSEFAAHVYSAYDAAMDRQVYTERQLCQPGDTTFSDHIVLTFQKRIALDTNWAVGKYVFAYSLGSAGAVVKASPPYRIR